MRASSREIADAIKRSRSRRCKLVGAVRALDFASFETIAGDRYPD